MPKKELTKKEIKKIKMNLKSWRIKLKCGNSNLKMKKPTTKDIKKLHGSNYGFDFEPLNKYVLNLNTEQNTGMQRLDIIFGVRNYW